MFGRNKHTLNSRWIAYYMDIAERTSELSYAEKLKVGCVIVRDNRILSIGYNGTPSGWSNVCEKDGKSKPEVLHAEANALMKLAKSTETSEQAILFITHEPCIECAKLIYQAGITTIYYKNKYTASKGSGLDFLNKAGVKVLWQNEP